MAAVKIHSGLFNKVVRFENPVKTADIAGGNSEDYAQAFTLTTRGYFKERSGFRQLEEGSYDQLVWEYEAYTWWRSELENNLTKDTRLFYENREYKIVSYKRMEEDRMFFRFLLIAAQ